MRILLTNDDGIHAPGILAAKRALERIGEVWLIAPERPRSAAGHAITLHKPLRIRKLTLEHGVVGYGTNGTPSDCVTLGYDVLMQGRCDLVVSGINAGSNLGWDITYSGTVAAAMEGAVLNLPAFAVSVTSEHGSQAPIDFIAAADFAVEMARKIASDPLPPNTMLNINVPAISVAEIRGVSITHQGRREYVDRIVSREDPSGQPYYWQAGVILDAAEPGSDVDAIHNNCISVTPIHLDLTAYALLPELRRWKMQPRSEEQQLDTKLPDQAKI